MGRAVERSAFARRSGRLVRDARSNIWSWRERLTEEEVARVRSGTQAVWPTVTFASSHHVAALFTIKSEKDENSANNKKSLHKVHLPQRFHLPEPWAQEVHSYCLYAHCGPH